MSQIGQLERAAQNRVVKLFAEELEYAYLGHWEDRPNNSNIEERFLTAWLEKRGYSEAQISQALNKLHRAADKGGRALYYVNRDVYQLLRYGVDVQVAAGDNHEKVELHAPPEDDPAEHRAGQKTEALPRIFGGA